MIKKVETHQIMNPEHPSYDAVIAWANGNPIQYKVIEYEWSEWEEWNEYLYGTPPFLRFDYQWRPKPKTETILFKSYLMKSDNSQKPRIKTIEFSVFEKQLNPENHENFVRWIDDDWREVEIDH